MTIFKFLHGNRPNGQKFCEWMRMDDWFVSFWGPGCPPLRSPLDSFGYCLTLSHFVSLRHRSDVWWCLLLMILMVSCVVLRLKPVLHHFKLAGSSRDHWLMPWDVPIASLWDHTALSPSSCLRVTPQKKTNKTKLLPNFWTHFVWFHHIMSLRIRACSIQRCRKNIAEGYMREHPAFGKRSRDAGAIASPISLPSWQPFAVCL